MDHTIFKKLKVKPGMTAAFFFAPPEYPAYEEFYEMKDGKGDFVHLFASSKVEFQERFEKASDAAVESGLLWVSYPKSSGKLKYDLNRDSLWDLVIPYGWHPVAQVSLDDIWSAIRLKRNEPDMVYERPNSKKQSRSI